MPRKYSVRSISLFVIATLSLLCANSNVDQVLDKVSKYNYGQSREFLTQLNDLVLQSMSTAEKQKEMELKLINVLNSDATKAAKEFICRQLSRIGSEKSVPVLIKLLETEATVDMALFALQRIPAEKASEQLRAQLSEADEKERIALINTLGERKDRQAVKLLAGFLSSADSELASSAAAALGKIGGEAAATTLKKALANASAAPQTALLDAYLLCADQFISEPQKALAIYSEVYSSGYKSHIRSAALAGIVRFSGESSLQKLSMALNGKDIVLQSTAISLLGELPAGTDLDSFAKQFPGLSPVLKVQMLVAFTDRNTSEARDLALNGLNDSNISVRLAALKSLAHVGMENDFLLLADIASKSSGDEKEAARASLGRLDGQNTDIQILAKIPDAAPALKAELIHSVGRRNIENAVDLLFENIHAADKEVSKESYQSLSVIAGVNEFNQILNLVVNAKSKSHLAQARSLAVKVAVRNAFSDVPVEAINNTLSTTEDPEIKGAMLNILGKTGSKKALQVLRKEINGGSDDLKHEAIKALALWPNNLAMNDLYDIVQKDDEPQLNRITALRGYIRIIGSDDNIEWDKKTTFYDKAMKFAEKVNEKRMIIHGLRDLESLPALELLTLYLDREDLRAEAEAAIIFIAPETALDDLANTHTVLKRIVDTTTNEQYRKNAQEILNGIDKN